MKRLLMTALLGTLAMAAHARADFSYGVSLSVLDAANNRVKVFAQGSITVDRLGSDLTASDVTGFSMQLIGTNGMLSFNPGNARVSLSGYTLSANATTLALNIQNNGSFSISTNDNNLAPSSLSVNTQFLGSSQQTTLSIFVRSSPSSQVNSGQQTDLNLNQFILSTSAVPEPSSLFLMGTAALGFGVLRRLTFSSRR